MVSVYFSSSKKTDSRPFLWASFETAFSSFHYYHENPMGLFPNFSPSKYITTETIEIIFIFKIESCEIFTFMRYKLFHRFWRKRKYKILLEVQLKTSSKNHYFFSTQKRTSIEINRINYTCCRKNVFEASL